MLNITRQPGTERVQALADISRSALSCHSNETRAARDRQPVTDRHTDGRDHYTR